MKYLRGELSKVYQFLRSVDTAHHYETLKSEHRIIELDFPVWPKGRDWSQSVHMKRLVAGLEARRAEWLDLLRSFACFEQQLRMIPLEPGGNDAEPHWLNAWIPGLDAVSLYAFTAQKNPGVFLEVGSGNSTKFVRKAIDDHGLKTKIVSIDPFPRVEIDRICDAIHRVALEELDLAVFDSLTPDDIVFIDNSHRALPNSDVTVFFMEVLGRLPKGILYGLHDIFLPVDYPDEWGPRFYNEQYLLAAYLFGGADGDDIVLPGSFISRDRELTAALDVLWQVPHLQGIMPFGGGFWMRKG